MRIHTFISETWDESSTIDEVREVARWADENGLAGGWMPYLPESLDSLSALQAAGEVSQRMELGSAVIPTYFFHPLALARQAATVQAAVGRPVTLGIGCSNSFVVEMHGLAYDRPAQHVREYLEALEKVREARSGQVSYEGEIFHFDSMYGTPGTGLGPVLVGALGPKMLAAAGAHSDGTIATMSDEGAIERVIVPQVNAAAKEAGRPAPRVGTVVPIAVTSDAAGVRDYAREKFSHFDTLPRYKRMIDLGNASNAAEVCVIGDERAVRDRLRGFADAGLTDFLAAPLRYGDDREASRRRTLECLASLVPDF